LQVQECFVVVHGGYLNYFSVVGPIFCIYEFQNRAFCGGRSIIGDYTPAFEKTCSFEYQIHKSEIYYL
jgi:hypothetical protein